MSDQGISYKPFFHNALRRIFSPILVELYRALRTVNPSPYMFLLEDPDFSVVGASPEVHVRLSGIKWSFDRLRELVIEERRKQKMLS